MPAQQLDLLDPTPERWPSRPYCSDGPGSPTVIRSFKDAIRKRWTQPNHPGVGFRLVFDVDRAGAVFAASDANIPEPSWVATNPANGHAHLAYEIEIPWRRGHPEPAQRRAQRLAALVERAYTHHLGADPLYHGLLCKSPVHPGWRTMIREPVLYSLADMAAEVEIPSRIDLREGMTPDTPESRNCFVFDALRQWAYQAIRGYWQGSFEAWHQACIRQSLTINMQIDPAWRGGPMAEMEPRHTAKSVAGWVWSRFSPEKFRLMQSLRGRTGGRRSQMRQRAKPARYQEQQRERGRKGGRAKGQAARERFQAAMRENPTASVARLAEISGVAVSSAYRYAAAERGAQDRSFSQ